MANTVVPVVLNQGGPPEVVRDGHDGFLWTTPKELRELTWSLVRNRDLRVSMATRAGHASQRFNTSAFRDRLNELVTELIGH